MIEFLICNMNLFCHIENMTYKFESSQAIVKYYEPGKSCYVNGIFYTKCEESNGTFATDP